MEFFSIICLFVVIFAEFCFGRKYKSLKRENRTCTKYSTSSNDMGIIVTGGLMDFKSVELLDANGSQICQLANFPKGRVLHTQDGLLSCGGGVDTYKSSQGSCVKFNSGVWTEQSMIHNRYKHSSWLMPTGNVLLMGGESYNVTINNASGVESHGGEKENEDYNGTEVITSGGSEDFFDLEFGVSYACSIQLIDQVIVTGGSMIGSKWYKMVTGRVTAYNINGFVENLPNLNIGRFDHGCGHYINEDGNEVYLVTGGRRNYNNHFILEFELSTEIIIHGDSSWTLLPLSSNLPSYKAGSASVSLDNKIFVTGGHFKNFTITNEILLWNRCTMKWKLVNHMEHARVYHGISLVPLESVKEYCVA